MISYNCGYWVFFNGRFYLLLYLIILNNIYMKRFTGLLFAYLFAWFTNNWLKK